MKRTLVIIVLCTLLLAMLGTTVVAAEQKGKSSIYQCDVTYGGKVVGKLVVNLKDPNTATYVLKAYGLQPSTRYLLAYPAYWVRPPKPVPLVPLDDNANANKGGTLHMKGTWTNPTTIAAVKENVKFTLLPIIIVGR